MRMIYYCICFVLCFLLSACSLKSTKKREPIGNNVISIDLDNNEPLQASTLFDTITYIPLETSDSFMFSRINHLKIVKDNVYFIADKSFFLFDAKTGKGKLRISKLNHGAEGYTSAFDSNIDFFNKEIEILDNNAKKIVIYDMQGNFKQSIPLPCMSFTFCKSSNSSYWLYNNNLLSDETNSKLVHYNCKNKSIEGEYDEIDMHMARFFFVEDETNIVLQDHTLLYHSSPSDIIYLIRQSEMTMEPAFVLDLGNYKTPKEFYAYNYQDIMEFVEAANKNDYVFEIPTFSANDNTLVIACMKSGRLYTTFYTKEDRKSLTFSSFCDDFHFSNSMHLKAQNMSFSLDDNNFYFIISSEQFLDLRPKGNNQERIDKWMKNNHISEFSNPILVKCRLKKS